MEELSWYVGVRIARNQAGGIHWFVESSDGLSGGHLVDEGMPTTVMAAVLAGRRELFNELIRLVATLDAENQPGLWPGGSTSTAAD